MKLQELYEAGVLPLPPEHDPTGTFFCPPHNWRETGVREPHTNVALLCGRTPRIVIRLRCRKCGQNGFRYPEHRVVYTWRS